MLLELLASAAFVTAPYEPVYLVDTTDHSIRHCHCVHLPDFSEYCWIGYQWRLYARWQVFKEEQVARDYLKMDIRRKIDDLTNEEKTISNDFVWETMFNVPK